MRAAAEFRIHRVDFHLDGDLDGALPMPHRRGPLGLVVRRPTVHWQQGRDFHAFAVDRAAEGLDSLWKDARRLEPFEKVAARAHLDPVVSEFTHPSRQLFERKMAVHERIQSDAHKWLPWRNVIFRGAVLPVSKRYQGNLGRRSA